MKKGLLSALICTSTILSTAQITITSSQMPSAGDSMRYSTSTLGAVLTPPSGGANQTWDYSTLASSGQFVDQYFSLSGLAITYQLAFGLPFGTNASNLMKPDPNGFALPSQLPVTIEDVVNFYKSDNDEFSQTGLGASINGLGIPITYSSRDVLCPLPLNYNTERSGDFSYQINIPTLGFYGKNASRHSVADGWGTLILPTGSYQVIRLKSTLTAEDSIRIDQFGFGFNIPVPDIITYTYYSTDYKFPVMQITSNVFVGQEAVTKVIYRDTLRDQSQSLNKIQTTDIQVYPNPATEIAVVTMELKSASDISYQLFDAAGRQVYSVQRLRQIGTLVEVLPIQQLNLSPGMYFIKIASGDSFFQVKPLLIDNH